MKRNTYVILTLALLTATVFSCTKNAESPDPGSNQNTNNNNNNNNNRNNQNNNNNNNQNGPDTLAMFTDKNWTVKKVYNDGVEAPDFPLIGAYYNFTRSQTYSFTFPGFPSAGGTWSFDTEGKSKVTLKTGSGPGTQWVILKINQAELVAEETLSSGVIRKFEFGL